MPLQVSNQGFGAGQKPGSPAPEDPVFPTLWGLGHEDFQSVDDALEKQNKLKAGHTHSGEPCEVRGKDRRCCYSQRMPGLLPPLEAGRDKEGCFTRACKRSTDPLTPGLQNWERIHSCCLELPSLWQLVLWQPWETSTLSEVIASVGRMRVNQQPGIRLGRPSHANHLDLICKCDGKLISLYSWTKDRDMWGN